MKRTFYGEAVMTEAGYEKLPKYKYNGSDASLIYKYFTGKIAQFLVDNIYPESLAYSKSYFKP